jgi:carbon monoxide dehydrogenase subunit G
MRLSEKATVKASPAVVWEIVSDPGRYLEFMSGATRWDVQDGPREGAGTRIRVLFRVGAAEIGGLIEIVEWAPERELAWTSITGLDQRGRWRIRAREDGGSTVEMRFSYGIAGAGIPGIIAERVGAIQMRRHLRRSLLKLKQLAEARQLEQRREATAAA